MFNATSSLTTLLVNASQIIWIGNFSVYPNAIYLQDLDLSQDSLTINISTPINLTAASTNYVADKLVYISLNTPLRILIVNNLTLLDAQVSFPVDTCDSTGNIVYRSDSGAFTQTFQRGTYSCEGARVTLDITGLENGDENELLIDYSCSTSTLVGYKLTILLSTLSLLLIVIAYLWKKGFENIEMKDLIILFIIIVIGTILLLGSGQNLGASCPVST